MKVLALTIIVISTCLPGCVENLSSRAANSGLTGSDRDEYGCIPSAGYRWCEKTAQCERPWELAETRDFDNTAEGFDAFCKQ